MKGRPPLIAGAVILYAALGFAQPSTETPRPRASRLGGAPASARRQANPYEGNPEAVRAGRKLFQRYCADCHGDDAGGRRDAPGLDSEVIRQAPPGQLFWVLSNGNLRGGMPSWSRLPDARRWQIVTFLKTLGPSPEPDPGPRLRGQRPLSSR